MKYPIGVQSFEKLRQDGCVYVDKTQHVYNLVQGYCYFLSRPRRFGKSLLVSTLEAYFLGRKDLFKGLAIEELEKDWTVYPVLYLNLNVGNFKDDGELETRLNKYLKTWEETYGGDSNEQSLGLRFETVIKNAYDKTGKKVVVLVDEYDKPMLDVITNKEKLDECRATLKGFYSALKGQDQYLRFVFLTGVTRFSHVSIFSDLNHLDDISMKKEYAEICGITETELHQYFDESINILASENNLTFQECCGELKKRYDGYHFHQSSIGMYNPFSLLKVFSGREFSDYWFASGTPTFLAELLRNFDYNLELLEETSMTADMIGNIETFDGNPIPILYQSGYLTIKGYEKDIESYILGYPNREVERAFTKFLIPYFSNTRNLRGREYLSLFMKAVRTGHPEEFLDILKTLFDDGDNRIAGDKEIYFQNCMYLIFKLMGFYVEVERCTSRGRIDIVLGTKDYLYVMELKVGVSAQEAIRQIDEKGYMLPFKQDNRKLVKIGVAFDLDTRTLTEWQIEGI